MQFTLHIYLPLLLSLIPLIHTTAPPTCVDPPTQDPPKLSDCEHVIRHIQRMLAETGNPLYTASRRTHSNVHCPILYWDHLPRSTCGVRLDMAEGREDATDDLRLSDVAYAANLIMRDCLTPGRRAVVTEGWMRAGKHDYVNVSVERLRQDVREGGRKGAFKPGDLGSMSENAIENDPSAHM